MRKILLSLALLLGCISVANATVYYVDAVSGTDQASCTSSPGTGASACRTISYVINNVSLGNGANPSHSVVIAAGTYREQIEPGTDDAGSSGDPVIFDGAGIDSTIITGIASSATLVDANAVDCNVPANCPSQVAGVYKFSGVTGTIAAIYETVWNNTVRIDDRNDENGGDCLQSTCSWAVYDLPYSVAYTPANSFTSVSNMAGSWYRDGSNDLFIRTWNSANPTSAGLDIEIASISPLINLASNRNYMTFKDMTINYSGQLVSVSYVTDLTMDNVKVHSGRGGLSAITPTNIVLTNSYWGCTQQRDYDVYEAATVSTTCDSGCGWYEDAQGSVIGLQGGSGAEVATGRMENNTVEGAWNAFGCDDCNGFIFRNNIFRNAPNHLFLIAPSGGNCTNNIIDRNITLNGQDGIYIAACTNTKVSRNITGLSQTSQGGNPTGTRAYSNLLGWWTSTNVSSHTDMYPFSVPTGGETGFYADYNWMPQLGMSGCTWGDSTYYVCHDDGVGTDWPDACSCQANQVYATSVALANATWPVDNGLTMGSFVRSDFYPPQGSSLIDAGDPDIDGDGTVETGSGQDDECTLANHCYGSAPDIGPFEYGIDVTIASQNNKRAGTTIRGGK